MNTNSNTYTVIYTTLVCVLVAAILAFVSQLLKPKQEANEKADKKAADAVVALIRAIGEVEYTDACLEKINAAKNNSINLTPEVGYCFYVNHFLSLEPSLYYNISLNDFSDSSKVGLKLGLGFYF